VPVAAIGNFYRDYELQFDKVPDIWLEDMPPGLMAQVREGNTPPELEQLQWSGWPGWRA
jgi:hypothetical protein